MAFNNTNQGAWIRKLPLSRNVLVMNREIDRVARMPPGPAKTREEAEIRKRFGRTTKVTRRSQTRSRAPGPGPGPSP